VPQRRLPVALALLACGMSPFAVAPGIWFLFPAAVLLGLAVAPAVIAGFSTVSLAVPADQVTEGLTWMTAALGIGISLGSAAAGQLAGGWGPRAAFGCAAGCAGAAALAGWSVRHQVPVTPGKLGRRTGRSGASAVRHRGWPWPRWPGARPGSAG
jgi:MFS family permease